MTFQTCLDISFTSLFAERTRPINESNNGHLTQRRSSLLLFGIYGFTVLLSSVLCTQGQCFVAINPENFAPGFTDRMSDLLSIQRGMDPVSRPCSYTSRQKAKMIMRFFQPVTVVVVVVNKNKSKVFAVAVSRRLTRRLQFWLLEIQRG